VAACDSGKVREGGPLYFQEIEHRQCCYEQGDEQDSGRAKIPGGVVGFVSRRIGVGGQGAAVVALKSISQINSPATPGASSAGRGERRGMSVVVFKTSSPLSVSLLNHASGDIS
jgi:hypothetical protein